MKDSFTYHVRALTEKDVDVMRTLLAVFGAAFEDLDNYTRAQPDDSYLRRLLSGDSFIAVAAIAEDEVIGGLAAYVSPKFEQARSEIYIYDLAVAEAYRRRGVATATIEKLKEVARARAAYAIFVQADHGDDAAVALYSKLGVREDVFHFDIAPAEDRAA